MAIKRVGFGLFADGFQRLEMHAGQRTDDFQVAEFLGANIHQQILAPGIVAIEALDGVLHRGREFAVRAAELLKQHVAEARIWLVDPDRVHEFLNVMIHRSAQ